MTDAANRYEALTWQLLERRASGVFAEGTLDEVREDEFLEQMDACWWEMSEAEREKAEAKIALRRGVWVPNARPLEEQFPYAARYHQIDAARDQALRLGQSGPFGLAQ